MSVRATPSARRSASLQVRTRSPCLANGASGRWSAAASQISAKFHPGMSLCVSCCWLRSNVGSGRRSDARGPTLPVLVAQLALVALARGEEGPLVAELEALRHLVRSDASSVGQQW